MRTSDGAIKTLLEQLYNGEWHSQSSLYAKGFGQSLISAAIVRGVIEVGGHKHEDSFRITESGREMLR